MVATEGIDFPSASPNIRAMGVYLFLMTYINSDRSFTEHRILVIACEAQRNPFIADSETYEKLQHYPESDTAQLYG